MDIKKIKSLAQLFENTDLSHLEITEGETKILLKRERRAYITQAAPLETAPTVASDNTPAQKQGSFIKAPFAGVFYTKPSPDSKPFVTLGDNIGKGDIICILEAMKLMNELKAETDGIIAEVCAENGSVVEFGQPLFRLK